MWFLSTELYNPLQNRDKGTQPPVELLTPRWKIPELVRSRKSLILCLLPQTIPLPSAEPLCLLEFGKGGNFVPGVKSNQPDLEICLEILEMTWSLHQISTPFLTDGRSPCSSQLLCWENSSNDCDFCGQSAKIGVRQSSLTKKSKFWFVLLSYS